MGERTAGDKMFEAYLAERGYDVPEHEPDLGIGVRPEYLVEHAGATCLTEVKQFAASSRPLKRGSGSYSQQQVLKPIRGQIHQAARKLREARALRHPLVVVLTDPQQAMFGLLTPLEIAAALLGDLQVQVPVSPGGQAGPARLTTGRDGELRHDHPYISAVTVIHAPGIGAGGHLAYTFITHSPAAKPLSAVFFRGPNDLVFESAEQEDRYVETR